MTFQNKSFLSFFLVGTVFFATACTSEGSTETDSATPGPSSSTPISTPTNTQKPCEVDNPDRLGEAIPRELVTDEYGEYCSLTVHPNLKERYLTVEDNPHVIAAGFTQEDLDVVQDAAYTYMVENYLDSPLLDDDNDDVFREWVLNSDIAPEWHKTYIDNYAEHRDGGGITLINIFAHPLPRDGDTRTYGVDINPSEAFLVGDGDYLAVKANIAAVYPADNRDILTSIEKHQPDKTREEILESHPSLREPDSLGNYTIVGSYTLAYDPKENDFPTIHGTMSEYTVFAPDAAFLIKEKSFLDFSEIT